MVLNSKKENQRLGEETECENFTTEEKLREEREIVKDSGDHGGYYLNLPDARWHQLAQLAISRGDFHLGCRIGGEDRQYSSTCQLETDFECARLSEHISS